MDAVNRNYSKRELDDKFKNIDTLIREKHDDEMVKIGEIIVQTTKTNGRVNKHDQLLNMILGALIILSIVIVPILGWGLATLVNIQSTITNSVQVALQAYNINK